MKRIILILFSVVFITAVMAVDFDISGELRTRAALYNDDSDYDGGHFDSRFQLRLDSSIHPDLQLGVLFEIGDIIWGEDFSGNGGGQVGGGSVNIKTNELYIDYMINALNAKIRFGRQYWADHASLILDDNFNGILVSKDDFMGLNTDFAFIKVNENDPYRYDGKNVFFANITKDDPALMGLLALYAKDQLTREANFTLMPYMSVPGLPFDLNATLFVDYQSERGLEDRIGFGASIKANAEIDDLGIGLDFLYANEEGLSILSPYYMNGLYIYGYGAHHDGVAIYWQEPYQKANDTGIMTLVGSVRKPLNPVMTLFGAAGLLMTNDDYIGTELNGGLEYMVIEDKFKVSGFGAFAAPEDGPDYNYVIGVNATVNF